MEQKLSSGVPARALAAGKKVCQPAIGATDFEVDNSRRQSWLFGMPLFYQYTVAYDLNSNPPAMAFLDGKCTQCDTAANFLSSEEQFTSSSRTLRRIDGPLRHPGTVRRHRVEVIRNQMGEKNM